MKLAAASKSAAANFRAGELVLFHAAHAFAIPIGACRERGTYCAGAPKGALDFLDEASIMFTCFLAQGVVDRSFLHLSQLDATVPDGRDLRQHVDDDIAAALLQTVSDSCLYDFHSHSFRQSRQVTALGICHTFKRLSQLRAASKASTESVQCQAPL